MKKILCLVCVVMSITACGGGQSISQQWETGGLQVPESVLYQEAPDGGFLLVSQINGEPTAKDGNGGIAKLSLDGAIIDQEWVTGLNAPKGMDSYNGKLYVSDIHDVVVIDIATQQVENRITVPQSKFLNDVAVDEEGVVYVSDSHTNKIHRIQNGASDVYLEGIEGANGLTFVDSDLYIGAGDTLWRVGEDQSLLKVAQGFEEGADGVEQVAENTFVVSCWAGLVYRVSADGTIEKLLDTREEGINTADIGWNPEREVLYIPTFFKNSVVAYALQ